MVVVTYILTHGGKAITCTTCRMTSWNGGDIGFLYCANCHQFHGMMARAIAFWVARKGVDHHEPS